MKLILAGAVTILLGIAAAVAIPVFSVVSSDEPEPDIEAVLRDELLLGMRDLGAGHTAELEIAEDAFFLLWLRSETHDTAALEAAKAVAIEETYRFVAADGRFVVMGRDDLGLRDSDAAGPMIPIGSVELPAGAWSVELPALPDGVQFAVVNIDFGFDDLDRLVPGLGAGLKLGLPIGGLLGVAGLVILIIGVIRISQQKREVAEY